MLARMEPKVIVTKDLLHKGSWNDKLQEKLTLRNEKHDLILSYCPSSLRFLHAIRKQY